MQIGIAAPGQEPVYGVEVVTNDIDLNVQGERGVLVSCRNQLQASEKALRFATACFRPWHEERQALDIVKALDTVGIAVRGGDLAALPLLKRMGATAAVRASCYVYTIEEEVERLTVELSKLA